MDSNIIAKQLKKHRKNKGWSQDKLAKESGVPYTTVTKIEIGAIKNPSSNKISKLASALGVQVEEITTDIKNAGKAMMKGAKAQVWAAASLFFQYLLYSDFVRIELESVQFEDFNLVFSGGKKLIVEVKLRENSFNFTELQDLYEKLLNKGGINEQDEILIIAKKFTGDVSKLLNNFKYFEKQYREDLPKEGFSDKHLDLIKRTKFWVVNFGKQEAKEVAVYMFSKLIDYGAPLDDIKRLFNNILVERFFEGSAKGESYTKEEFLKEIEEEKLSIVRKDGRFSDEIYTLDEQLDNLRAACEKVGEKKKSDISIENVITAASTNPTLMSYILSKLETISNIDLSLIKPILNLNKNYQYSFSTGRILKQSIISKENIEIILEYLEQNLSALVFIRGDWFWITDFIEIADQVVEFDKKYAEEVVPLIEKILNKNQTNYLYIRQDKRSYEIGKLVDLMVKLFDLVSKENKKRLFDIANNYFSISNRNDDFDFSDKHNLFVLIEKYFNYKNTGDVHTILEDTIGLLIDDYKKGFQRYGSKLKFKGYEVIGSMSSWHGNEYSVSDKDFIPNLLTPLLEKYLEGDPESFFKHIDQKIMSKNISAGNPDFVRRALIPVFLNEYFSNRNGKKDKVKNYLANLIKEVKYIPSKSELIFQIIYKGQFPDQEVWELLKISTDEFNLPQNPFIEKITRKLIDSEDKAISKQALNKIIKWLSDPKYRDKSASWHGDMVENFEEVIKRSPELAIEIVTTLIREGYLEKLNNFDVYEYADLIRGVLKDDFDKGFEVIKLLNNKKELTRNEQVLLLYSLHNITERDSYSSEYLNKIYSQFIIPFFDKYYSIELIYDRLPHSNAREAFIDIAESIIRNEDINDRIEKGLRILNTLVEDPDPFMPGEDPEDKLAKYSTHKRILEGQDSASISSVRGKIAYTLGLTVFSDSRDKMSEIIELCDTLVLDNNFQVFDLLGHTIERLGMSRLWVMPNNSDELFLSTDKETALRLSKKIESIAFKYLHRFSQMPEQAQIAMGRIVSHAFNHIRALNMTDVLTFFDLIESLTPDVMKNFAVYYIYYSFYRKEQYNNWNHKVKGLYDDLGSGMYQEEVIFERLTKALKTFGKNFQIEVLFKLENLLEDKPEKKKQVIKIIDTIIEEFEIDKFDYIYRFVDDLIEKDFELGSTVYKKALKKQHEFLNSKKNKDKLEELRQLNYHYEIDVILKSIYENEGENEFLNTIILLFDVPIKIYIYKMTYIDDILKNLSKSDLVEKVFKLLYKIDSRYYDMFIEWKNRNR